MVNLGSIVAGLATDVAINTIGFVYSAIHQTEHFYDACGTGSFLASSAVTVVHRLLTRPGAGLAGRQLLLLGTTGVWATRLYLFLTRRIHRLGRDSRFNGVKDKPALFSVYWAVQALWVAIVVLPTVVVIAEDADKVAPLGTFDALGFAVWMLGFLLEAVADQQKAVWQTKLGPNRGKEFIHTGLWSLCRYPNYAGEITLWFGSYLMAASAFPQSLAAKYGFSVSPLFIMFILTNLSGIPIQEAQARKRFRNNAEYAKYVTATPLLIPWPWAKSSAKSS
ncbi:hypothetical protein BC830DRAFT_1165034 [Chytriomyces sp. MP71]|nr:hypothetical protein BC830DRAFT_1165034 [Chytriomyces sp. MP71]